MRDSFSSPFSSALLKTRTNKLTKASQDEDLHC